MIREKMFIWISQMIYLRFESLELLINKYGSLEKLWNLSNFEFSKNSFLTQMEISDLGNINYRKNLDQIYEYLIKYNIQIIGFDDFRYPIKLKFIDNRPKVLFVKGNISNINNESVAIVGSRNASNYGIKNAKYFSESLSKKGLVIISGLAKGIDSIVHKSVLACGGITYAILAHGLDFVYPKVNLDLFMDIIKSGGAVISEYVIGVKPQPKYFVQRNRIISGLANAVIVVEANERSGALITAEYAIEQGREVWAIPGNIFNDNAKGANNLIKDGANCLTNLMDILK